MADTKKTLKQKIQEVKVKLLEANLKKTGHNEFNNFWYYELSDIMPSIIKFCSEAGLFTKVSFSDTEATLKITEYEGEAEEIYTSPMKDITIKGSNEIQALGGVETYQRRYLYMTAFDISENDLFDATSGKDGSTKKVDSKTTKMSACTKGQIEMINSKFTKEEIKKALAVVKKEKIEDLTVVEASSLLKTKAEVKE